MKNTFRLALAMVAVFALAFAAHLITLSQLTLGGSAAVVGLTFLQGDDAIKYLISIGFLDTGGGIKAYIKAKTADYQIVTVTDPSGTLFTNRGAVGAVTFTLPAVAQGLKGTFYEFRGLANQTFTVAAAAGTVATFNNAAATSVACSTGGQKIGACIRAFCDGTSWFVEGTTVGVAYTVA